MNFEEGYQKVLQKTCSDDAYRARLVKNPNEAIKEVVGPVFPAGITFCVHENTDKIQHFVLPPLPSSKAELSDVELEQVAGGKGLPIPKCFLRWPIPIGPKPFTWV